MTLIDGDRIVTAQLYDDQYEEFTEKKMSIIDFVNAYSDEGVTTADDVLDKIRAEIEANAYPIVHGVNNHEKGMTLYGILQIIDRYRKGVNK